MRWNMAGIANISVPLAYQITRLRLITRFGNFKVLRPRCPFWNPTPRVLHSLLMYKHSLFTGKASTSPHFDLPYEHFSTRQRMGANRSYDTNIFQSIFPMTSTTT